MRSWPAGIGREVHDVLDSTNAEALRRAAAGEAGPLWIMALSQTAARGRRGRAWASPAGNFGATLLIRPPGDAALRSFVAALGLFDAMVAVTGRPELFALKWPNDVLLGGLKTSGILVELGAEAARVAFLVLGIGVNLNVDRATFPEEFRALATSVSSHRGRRVDRAAFARRLYRILEATLDACAAGGFAAVRPRFEARFRMPGRRIRVRELDGSELAGTALGIDADGALRMRCDAGDEVRVVAGDVTLAKDGA